MNQAITMHGWAGDASNWRHWREELMALGWHWSDGERGYGNLPPRSPSWLPEPGRRLLIAHSLGLHLLPSSVLETATDVVLLGSFGRFVPSDRAGRAIRAGLAGMASALGSSEERGMLERFLTRAAQPLPLSALPPSSLLEGVTAAGRHRLAEDLTLLQECSALPAAFPANARVLVVQGNLDAIVPAISQQQLTAALPGDRIEIVTLPDWGHALINLPVLARVRAWLEQGP